MSAPQVSVHYLDPRYASAKRVSSSQLAAKIKAGWVFHSLSTGFCSVGGCATYKSALVHLERGEILLVSSQYGFSVPEGLPVLFVDYSLVELSVPFAEKDEAKASGAIWVAWRKAWACAPSNTALVERWGGEDVKIFNLLES